MQVDDPEPFRQVDECVCAHQPDLQYSPVRADGCVVFKILKTALADADLKADDRVEVHAAFGNFGSFGYCWTVTNIFRAQGRWDSESAPTTSSSSAADPPA